MPNAKSWRDRILIHAAADLFPLLPPELRALADDIKRSGLRHSATFYRRESDGQPVLLDGQ